MSGTGPGLAAGTVQLLFAAVDGSALQLDLVALDDLAWGAGRIESGRPFSLCLGLPGADDGYLVRLTAAWADRAAVIEIGLPLGDADRWIVLAGDDLQVLLEMADPGGAGTGAAE